MPVDPTRSQNITVIGRRSADAEGPVGGADFVGERRNFRGGMVPANAGDRIE